MSLNSQSNDEDEIFIRKRSTNIKELTFNESIDLSGGFGIITPTNTSYRLIFPPSNSNYYLFHGSWELSPIQSISFRILSRL